MKSSHTTNNILPSRWSSAAFLRRDPQLLSFDIFGFALNPVVLDPDDVHRLVASYLRRKRPDTPVDYLERRLEAEDQARRAAAELGRHAIALAEVTDRLTVLLDDAGAGSDGEELAALAVQTELQLQQYLHEPRPDARQLHRDASDRGTPVAFVADSLLPRDLVVRMLRRAGYGDGLVLVSSHEGRAKTSGRLFDTLVERSGVPADRITHVGPDPVADVERATEAGLIPIQVTPARAEVRHRFELGLDDRTGIDAIALALAADRLGEVEHEITAGDIGYYAGGPLVAGFAGWVGATIDDLEPDHVIFCGPSGRLLRDVTASLRPDLAIGHLHALEGGYRDDSSPASLTDLAESLELADGDHLLAVDLGWRGQPHRWLGPALEELGLRTDLTAAYLGTLEPIGDECVRVWALPGTSDCPRSQTAQRRIEVLSALIPATDPRHLDDAGRCVYSASSAPALASGIRSFATTFQDWLHLEPHETSPMMSEPALRIITAPTAAEAEVLGRFPTPDPVTGRVRTLAALPPRNEMARNPRTVEAAATDALWPPGYEALTRGDARLASSARRLRRGIRRNPGPPPQA